MKANLSTVADYCQHLGWGALDLAKEAQISNETAYKANRGESLSNKVKRKIAAAISKALDTTILVGDIQWGK